jgi:hypothetical protein
MSTPSPRSTSSPSPLATLLLGVRFLTELALVAAAAWAGAARTRSIPLAVVLGVVAAVVVAAIWGLWIAPTSRRRLPDPARLALEIVLFAAAAAGLAFAGRAVVGAAIGIVGAATAVAVRFVPEPIARREEPSPPPSPPAVPDEPGHEAVQESRPKERPAPLRRPRGRDRARPRN